MEREREKEREREREREKKRKREILFYMSCIRRPRALFGFAKFKITGTELPSTPPAYSMCYVDTNTIASIKSKQFGKIQNLN